MLAGIYGVGMGFTGIDDIYVPGPDLIFRPLENVIPASPDDVYELDEFVAVLRDRSLDMPGNPKREFLSH
jgi:hypothetical protein